MKTANDGISVRPLYKCSKCKRMPTVGFRPCKVTSLGTGLGNKVWFSPLIPSPLQPAPCWV